MSSDIEDWSPPRDAAAFESLCLELWRDIWQDDGAQKNGRSGQPQAGVDIFGRRDGKWIGVQCKQKNGSLRSQVTSKELDEQVEAAQGFKPPLDIFVLATTGPRDAKIQEHARGLAKPFKIEIWSWNDIWAALYLRTSLLKSIGPVYWPRLASPPTSKVQHTQRDPMSTTRRQGNAHLPPFSYTARNARRDLQELLWNSSGADSWSIQGKSALEPACPVNEQRLDFICTVLRTNSGQSCLVVPDADSSPGFPGVGRTSLLTRIFNIRLPYTQYMPTHGCVEPAQTESIGHRPAIPELSLRFENTSDWQLVAADMAYLAAIGGKLCAIPLNGEHELLIWDIIRHLFRSSKLDYNPGDQHTMEGSKWRQTVLRHTSILGIEKLYSGPRIHDVSRVISLRRIHGSTLAVRAERMDPADGLSLIEGGLKISSESHPAPFWSRPIEDTATWVRGLLAQIRRPQLPIVHRITIESPLDGSVPRFAYDWVKEALGNCINGKAYQKSLATLVPARSDLLQGIDAHNAIVFERLPSTRRVTMAVRTGAKVFDDAAFWRHFSGPDQRTQLEIILLDPNSPDVADIEREDYPDKPSGFLKQEITASIEGIQNAQRALGMPQHIRYVLTKCRTPHRVTILDDASVLAAPYFPGLRTGNDTVFSYMRGQTMGKVIEAYCRYCNSLIKAAEKENGTE